MVMPRYRSEARVLIENQETAYNRPEADKGGERNAALVDAEAVQSQVQLVQSRDLARKVVYALKLNELKEFNSESTPKIIFNAILSLAGMGRAPSKAGVEERAIDRFTERLSVYAIEKSRVIVVDFQSENPELAAKVANAVATEYLAIQRTTKAAAMKQASQWLLTEIDGLRGRVAEAEAKVETFRAKSNLYVGNNNNQLGTQTLGELNTQIVAARTQKSDYEARARLIRGMLKTGKPLEVSEILNSDLMRRLSEQRAALRAQLAEQSSTLLQLHPRIKELHAQIASLDIQIRAEADKLARALENDSKVAAAKLENLLASLDQMKNQQAKLGGDDVQLRALEREAKAQRDLLESYLARYRDATARETPGGGGARCAGNFAGRGEYDRLFPEEAPDRSGGEPGRRDADGRIFGDGGVAGRRSLSRRAHATAARRSRSRASGAARNRACAGEPRGKYQIGAVPVG
jgi:uncharacterized protein involved in exopolysaccharide biosynthesis